MASKLYKHGNASADASVWQPVAKGGNGIAPIAGQPVADGLMPPGQDLHQHLLDFERRLNEERQTAYQRGLHEGEASARQAIAQFQTALERLARTIEEVSSLR